ncbi:hypothetical protein ACH3XW_35890 [Acanthocheilonema viteae]
MAVTSRCGKEQQQLLEGIVTYCDDRLARVWIDFAYRSRHFNLETRVLKIGVAQVRTEVIFGERNEKIGHGIIIQSKHFGRVAVFSPFSGIIRDRIYSVYVERISRDQQWNEQESDTYWFVPSNQVPKLLPISKYPMNDTQLIGPLTGVVVSKTRKSAFVWTPSLGEGICENDGNLVIGGWIEFTANLYFENHMHMNINFRIIDVLSCVPLFNNLVVCLI